MIFFKNNSQNVWVNALGIFLFLFLVSPVLTVGTAHAQKIATLESVKGDVRIFKPGKKRGIKGRDGMALFHKTIVKTTNADSFADIVYNKGGRVRVMPNSELALASADFSKGKMEKQIDLITGKIFNVVDKLTENDSYVVKTATATSGVKGTIFSASTTGSSSVFMVKEGAVEAVNLAGAQQPVLVNALKKTVVSAGQAPTTPVPLTPAEIAMFDILDDLFEREKADIMDDTMEAVKEDIIQDMIHIDP
ncbi:MAG: FecR family protein [Nitrospinales bacterium]